MDNHLDTLVRRAEILEERLSKIKSDVVSPHSYNLEDQAQERENDEVLDTIADSTQEELDLIYKALQRQERGEYGICQRCHKKIDDDRLNAIPETEFCVSCAA